MPKRKAEREIAYHLDKIKKLQKVQSRKYQRIISSSSDSDSDSNDKTNPEITVVAPRDEIPVDTVSEDTQAQACSQVTTPIDIPPIAQQDVDPDIELDPDILLALGSKSDDGPNYGDKIHENLSQLWTPILKKGYLKKTEKKMLKEYLVPQNCTLLQAPKLNLEVAAALTEASHNRDKKIGNTQQQLGSAITALNRGLDILLQTNNKDEKQLNVVKHLSNACRLLCDLHYLDSNIRTKLILPSLDKNFLSVLQDTTRDETLFGTKLAEKIKATKAIEKQGLQIKKFVLSQSTQPTPSTSRAIHSRGNWSAPPRYQTSKSSRGGNRKIPMRKPPPAPPVAAAAAGKPNTRQHARSQAHH